MYWEAGKKMEKKWKETSWNGHLLGEQRGKKKSTFHMQHNLGKVLLKVSYLARRASSGTQTKIPQNDLPFISAGFLWVLLYSIDTARDHGDERLEQWLSRLRTGEGEEILTTVYYKTNKQIQTVSLSPFTPTWPSLSTLLFKVKAPSTMPYLEFLINAIWWR